MITLTDFLLARIAEDEADLCHCCDDGLGTVVGFARADLAAKRRIVEAMAAPEELVTEDARRVAAIARLVVLGNLAAPYSDHPDWREEWRP